MKMWTLWKVTNDQTLPILVHEWLDCCFLSSYSLSLAWSFLLLGKIKIPNPRVTSTFWQHLMKSEDLFLKPTPEAFNTSQNPIIPLLKYPITLHHIWFPRLQKKKANKPNSSSTGVFLEDWLDGLTLPFAISLAIVIAISLASTCYYLSTLLH